MAEGPEGTAALAVELMLSAPTIDLTVRGTPQPAGSKKAVPIFNRYTKSFVTTKAGRPVVAVMDAAKGSRSWKQLISGFAKDYMEDRNEPPIPGPIGISFVMEMPRPQSHYRTGRHAGQLKDWAQDICHCKPPDALKLARAAEDALTGVFYRDDSQIVLELIEKKYGPAPGSIRIRVWQL